MTQEQGQVWCNTCQEWHNCESWEAASALDPEQDVTDEYHAFEEAYRRMEGFEAQDIEYDWDMLW